MVKFCADANVKILLILLFLCNLFPLLYKRNKEAFIKINCKVNISEHLGITKPMWNTWPWLYISGSLRILVAVGVVQHKHHASRPLGLSWTHVGETHCTSWRQPTHWQSSYLAAQWINHPAALSACQPHIQLTQDRMQHDKTDSFEDFKVCVETNLNVK